MENINSEIKTEVVNEDGKVVGEGSGKWVLPASIVIAGILIAGAVIYSTGLKNSGLNSNNLSVTEKLANLGKPKVESDDVVLGDKNAKLTLIEFGDFQCPFCAKFSQEIEKPLREKYVDTGKINIVYKPLAFLDRTNSENESKDSVSAVECAKEQGKFWEFHDKIFLTEYAEVQKVISGAMQTNEGNGNLNRDFFKKTASDIGLNVDAFLSCYNSGKYKDTYQKYGDEASKAMPQGIGTPAVFINGEKIDIKMNQATREYDFQAFSAVLDELLK